GITFSGATLQVASVSQSSPLQALGLRAGDIITAINGRPVTGAQNMLQTLTAIGANADATATLTVSRSGLVQSLDVTSAMLQAIVQAQTGTTATTTNSSTTGTGSTTGTDPTTGTASTTTANSTGTTTGSAATTSSGTATAGAAVNRTAASQAAASSP